MKEICMLIQNYSFFKSFILLFYYFSTLSNNELKENYFFLSIFLSSLQITPMKILFIYFYFFKIFSTPNKNLSELRRCLTSTTYVTKILEFVSNLCSWCMNDNWSWHLKTTGNVELKNINLTFTKLV